MKLFFILLTGLVTAGSSMVILMAVTRWQRAQKFLISADAHRNASPAKMMRSIAINSAASLAVVFGLTLSLRHVLFYDRPTPWLRLVADGLAVILIYDFGYYIMHRWLFHEWRVLRPVHAVHHAAQNPRAIDSFLLHPIETVMGLGLLLLSIAAVGGIHVITFAPIFVGYTTLNVFNHAGLDIPRFPWRTLGKLAVAHDKHHHSMANGNYASLTPLPDIIFGTFE
jgi:sterol desaturase/sphingolipid hydroxylase (fatty acid hydroxylase superfamily)